jgi:hypothetical protein
MRFHRLPTPSPGQGGSDAGGPAVRADAGGHDGAGAGAGTLGATAVG